jgi:type I restriction enzyme M protein
VLDQPAVLDQLGHHREDADGSPAWAPKFPERFRTRCRLAAKKADLMFLQHMVHVTRDGGMIATVMPHGVLFRGGDERDIRAAIDSMPTCWRR